jgi:Predicted membrane protein (DUF2306)
MHFSPILFLHIGSGTVSVLCGFAAISLRKGSRGHRMIGNVFFISMLGLGVSGAYMGFMKSQVTNVLAGVLTCYLVATSWITARRREASPGVFDWVALLVVLAVGATEVTFGLEAARSPTGLKYGYPVWPYALFASVALLAAVGDVRMLVHRGVSGTQRLVRHLWRMCFAFFIASASIFLARPHLFPAVLRKTYIIPLLGFLPLILMIFWLVRVRFTSRYKQKMPSSPFATASAKQLRVRRSA